MTDLQVGPSQAAQRAAYGAVAYLGRGVVVRGVSVSLGLVLAALLGPADLGVYSAALSIVSVVGTVLGPGLAIAYVRRLEAPTEQEMGALVAVQVTGGSLAVVATVWAAWVAGPDWWALPIMMASVPIMALKSPPTIALERRLAFKSIALIESAEAIVVSSTAVLLAVFGFGVALVAVAVPIRSLVGSRSGTAHLGHARHCLLSPHPKRAVSSPARAEGPGRRGAYVPA